MLVVGKWEYSSRQARFERQADNLVNALQRNLDRYVQITRFLGGFYDSSSSISSEQFQLISQNILPYNRNIVGVGWAPRVSKLKRASDRAEHFPIIYIEPKEQKPPLVLGYDLYSQSQHQAAIEKVKKTGVIVQTRLDQNTSSFIIYRPLYDSNSLDATLENFELSFRGVVFTVYQLKDMVETSIKANELNQFDFYLYNSPLDQLQSSLMKPSLNSGKYFLLSYNDRTQQIRENGQTANLEGFKEQSCPFDREWFKCLRTLNIAKDEWSILILPRSELATNQGSAMLTFAIGLVATTALVIYLWMSLQLQKSYTTLEQVNQDLEQANQNLEQANQNLEHRVVERTAELQAAKEAAETASVAKDRFLINISHELRTPLNIILGYAQILLRSHNLDPAQILGLRIVKQSGNDLLTLINDILDFSKIKASKIELCLSEFHLSNFLEEIVGIAEMQAKQKDLIFRYESLGNLDIGIRTDEKRLRQVLLNLLGNAVKFTHRGEVTFKVSVIAGVNLSGSFTRTNIRFEVIDTGIGISPEQIEKIFHPFEQVTDWQSPVAGTGLGLSISQQVLKLMGSQIKVESQLGKGSTFSFDLTFDLVKFVKEIKPHRNNRYIGYKGKKRQILIVDNRKENRLLLLNILEPLGFKVIEASNGQEGLEIARSQRPDLILTDLLMPIKTGLTMVLDLRQILEFKNIPIISFSASHSKILKQQSHSVGCNAFIPKPIDEKKLLALLEQYLHLKWVFDFVE